MLKNLEKRCKVLQKSRFGESGIQEKLSLEGKLRSHLRLSWLVGGQLAAKMGKLTLIGGQKGTKLELRGALGTPKEGPRGPKRARETLALLRRP